jgi:polysaccharide export outer membrane protein
MFSLAKYSYFGAFLVILTLSFPALSQQAPAPGLAGQNLQNAQRSPGAGAQLPPDSFRPNYVLGPNDQFLIRAPLAEELNDKPFRIDSEGFVNLPIIGRFRAGSLTVQELEAEIVKRLREFIREPQVSISVTQFRSDPVFFVGAFKAPGIYPLQGRRTLVEMLTSVGGLLPNASRHITITRRLEHGTIPLPNAVEDRDKKVSTVDIGLGSLQENVNPAEDIILEPYDVISVELAERIYMNGEVKSIAGIELGERESMSMLQALTVSGGFTKISNQSKVLVLRPILGTNKRAEIKVNVKRILKGQDNDFPLLPNDVVYVARSDKRVVITTVAQTILSYTPFILLLASQ